MPTSQTLTTVNASINFKPVKDTIYSIKAVNANKYESPGKTVKVTVLPVPTVSSFSVTPTTITVGDGIRFDWSTANAVKVEINGVSYDSAIKTATIANAQDTTYTIVAINANGYRSVPNTVTITVLAKPTIASFSVSSTTITAGEDVIFTWNTPDASKVSINGTQYDSTLGTVRSKPVVNTDYTFIVYNANGYASAPKTISVTVLAVPVVTDFSSVPITITTGEEVTLSWKTTGASSVIVSEAS